MVGDFRAGPFLHNTNHNGLEMVYEKSYCKYIYIYIYIYIGRYQIVEIVIFAIRLMNNNTGGTDIFTLAS